MISILQEKSMLSMFVSPKIEPSTKKNNKNELIILIHGWLSNATLYKPMSNILRNNGFDVYRMDLSATFGSVEKIKKEMTNQLTKIDFGNNYEKVHFVASSMGGLFLKLLLNDHEIPKLNRIVTLGTPYKGTVLVNVLEDTFPFKYSYPIKHRKKLMRMVSHVKPKNKEYELGLIAGDKTYKRGDISDKELDLREKNNIFKGKPNDGTVTVDSALGETFNVKDRLVLHMHHRQMIFDKKAINHTIKFLKTGKFK